MLRKMTIALAIATAGISIGATEASARGGHGGGFHGHFHGGGFFFGPGFGYFGGYGYPYWDFPYSSYLYEDEPECYQVLRRVHTRHGWRTRRVIVCS
jgi:hypothetical protein